jgi:tetratricopeptide (TPR) repeat protein
MPAARPAHVKRALIHGGADLHGRLGCKCKIRDDEARAKTWRRWGDNSALHSGKNIDRFLRTFDGCREKTAASVSMTNMADKMFAQARAARREHRPNDARKDLVEATALCRHSGDRSRLANALADLGQIERDLRNLEAARKHYAEAVEICREAGDARTLAHTIRHLGDVLQELDELAEAEKCYGEALDLYRADAATKPLELANAIRSAAILRDRLGESEKASALWAEARDLYAAADIQVAVAECSRRMAGENRADMGLKS